MHVRLLCGQVYFQINHPSIEDEYKNVATFRPFRISVRYFFFQPFIMAAFFNLFYSQFEREFSLRDRVR